MRILPESHDCCPLLSLSPHQKILDTHIFIILVMSGTISSYCEPVPFCLHCTLEDIFLEFLLGLFTIEENSFAVQLPAGGYNPGLNNLSTVVNGTICSLAYHSPVGSLLTTVYTTYLLLEKSKYSSRKQWYSSGWEIPHSPQGCSASPKTMSK